MGRAKTLAQQIAELDEPLPKDFDPEEERPAQDSNEDSGSEESDDGLAGTEHYVDVGKSKLRKRDEVAWGPQYAGSRISREQLLEGDDDEPESESGDESAEEVFSTAPTYADPEASDFEIDDEDEDINSDDALGESDEEKFKDFTFRGSGKPREKVGARKRATAVDFMSESEEEELGQDGPEDETDEDLLDVDMQHAEDLDDEEEDSSNGESDGEDMLVFEEHESVGSDDENDKGSGEEDSDDEEEDEEDDEDEDESDAGDDEAARRAELRKMMSEEQKTVVATISQAAKADADKGNAVKQQRKAFDSLLNVRIRLQKALVATNTMATIEDKDGEEVPAEPYQGAQEAAIQLWNTLDKIRFELSKATSLESNDRKRKRIDSTTSSSKIWKRMKTSEVASIDVRQTTLEKWSAKVKGATALPLSRKLNPTASQQTITSVLQEQLASSDQLVKRTKYPRSCAPVQAKQKVTEDPNIFDDADFYQMLLKELVDQRMMDSSGALAVGENGKPTQWTAVKEAKTRKNVDTKASKGRKMRFTVHEKLQNFMAPEERGSWEPDAIDRFFGTLLGQKMTLGEDEQEGEEEDDGSVPLEEEGLMLFRS